MYNAEPFINECLNSIISQALSLDLYEVIIINDGSTDNSKAIVQTYLNKFPNFKLFNQENKGQSAARNLGIYKATGDYIQFVDADDFLVPDSLHQVAEFAQSVTSKNANDMIIFGLTGGLPATKNIINQGLGKCKWQGNGYDYIATHNYNNSPCYYWLNKSFISKIGLQFTEGKLCEDGMFTLTALLNAKSLVHVDSVVYFYATRPNSTTSTINPERRRKIVEGFKYAINYFNKMIDVHKTRIDKGQSSCIQRITSRRDSYTFFLLIRLLKMGAYDDAQSVIGLLKKQDLYPIKHFIGPDYPGVKLKILTLLVNCRPVYFTLCKAKSYFELIK